MGVKIKGIDTEKNHLLVEIDVANTENLGAALEAIDIIAAENGLLPDTTKKNFPIFNKHKGLTDQLQFDILDLITEKTNLERKAFRDELEMRKANSIKTTKIKDPAIVIQLIKIVDQEKKNNPNNYWESAQLKCIEYLRSINSDKSEEFATKDKEIFIQYIGRKRKDISS